MFFSVRIISIVFSMMESVSFKHRKMEGIYQTLHITFKDYLETLITQAYVTGFPRWILYNKFILKVTNLGILFFFFNKWRERNEKIKLRRHSLTYFLIYSCPVIESNADDSVKMRIAWKEYFSQKHVGCGKSFVCVSGGEKMRDKQWSCFLCLVACGE